jgi:plasmid replication initiation protein
MTLQELRFFSIYLSKINKDKPDETRAVRFPLDDFRAIMDLGRVNTKYIQNVTDNLLKKIVRVPDDNGGQKSFQLFKECTISIDDNGKWYVEIDAHDKALPLMFDFKNKYFSYHLWNALRLKSPNQLRMYEILKQYQKVGHRILSVEDLKGMLGIEKDEYPYFSDFKKRVLNACQQALEENTDIKFTYEPHGKKGPTGKILTLKFNIKQNENYTDQLSLDSFIESQKAADGGYCDDEDDVKLSRYEQRLILFSDACNNEFSREEMVVIINKVIKHAQYVFHDDIACYHYINDRYCEMIRQSKRNTIASRFGYVSSLMDKEV